MFDFGFLSPEINSGRMYTGAGSGPMLAAAAAWSALSADLASVAQGHRSVIVELTGGPWVGPASQSLVAAVTPFIAWLDSGAAEAEQAASQAFTAAAAYEAAFAATIPPPVIAANRALLAALVATNFLGINTPAIMATEAVYAEFWAQDAAAMYSYAGNSAAATELTELPQPAEVTDPTGLVDQAIAGLKAGGQAVQAQLNNLGSQIAPRLGDVLQTLSSPLNGQGTAIDQWIAANTPLDDIVPLYTKYLSPYLNSVALFNQSTLWFGDDAAGFSKVATLANTMSADAAKAAAKATQAAGAAARSGVGGVAASLGKALPIGKLSAPASWTMATEPSTAGAKAISNVTAIPAAADSTAGNVPGTGPFGQFVNAGSGRKTPAYGHRLKFMTRPPAAG